MFFDFVMLPTFLPAAAAVPASSALIIIPHVSEVKGSVYDMLHANKQKSMNIIGPVSSSARPSRCPAVGSPFLNALSTAVKANRAD